MAMLYRNTPTGVVGLLFAVGIVVALLWKSVSHLALVIWAAFEILVIASVVLDYVRFQKQGMNRLTLPARQINALFSGVIWGVSTIVIMPPSLDRQVLLLLVICIISFSNITYHSSFVRGLYLFAIPALCLSALGFALQGGQSQWILAIGMLRMLAACLKFGRNANETLTRAITTGFRNDFLVAELERKNQVADKANIAKTRFLASASHDLRQPMHTIGLLVSILRERKHDPEDLGLVNKIQTSVNAMESLFKGLLDISRLDAGMVNPKMENFPLEGVLNLIRLNYGPFAREQNIELQVIRAKSWVRSDPIILERIISNLVSNAIRHGARSKVLVGYRRRRKSIELQVWDDGPGIPADKHETIFDEFVQLHNPERDRDKGLGLGLSIVRRSAALLGHEVTLRSRAGIGSCFCVFLKRMDAHILESAVVTSNSLEENAVRGSFVLVIDDEQDIRFAMQLLLEQWGCHVLCARSTQEAIEQLGSHLRSPDLILSDYRLGEGENGILAIEAIRAHYKEHIPAIVISGDISAGDLLQVSEHGLPLAHKPLSAEQLRKLMAETLAPESVMSTAKN